MSSELPSVYYLSFFFFQAEDGIRDYKVTGVQTCALPILPRWSRQWSLRIGRRVSRRHRIPPDRHMAETTGTPRCPSARSCFPPTGRRAARSEEHTSELQSPCNLVCRLLLEKKKQTLITSPCSSSWRHFLFVPGMPTYGRSKPVPSACLVHGHLALCCVSASAWVAA